MIANKYDILSKIGQGKFGQVFEGKYLKSEERVAIKFELPDAPIKMLKHETTILNYLYENRCRNIPAVYWYGMYNKMSTLIMPFYKLSIHEYHKISAMSKSCIDRYVLQMLNILEHVHSHFVIHRDIKPQNFMINNDELVLIDFGLATIYVDEYKEHVPLKTGKMALLGTPKFVSIHIHEGIEPSRRDDLVSLGYIWQFLRDEQFVRLSNTNSDETPVGRSSGITRGSPLTLRPSPNVETATNFGDGMEVSETSHIMHIRNQEILHMKYREREFCFSQENGCGFIEYMKLVYELHFNEKPNYEKISQCIGKLS